MSFARKHRLWPVIGSFGVLLLGVACLPAAAADAGKPPPIRIAVFDFELEDVSAAASQPGQTPADAARLQDVSNAARRVLAQSGRYNIIDVSKLDAPAVQQGAADLQLVGRDLAQAGAPGARHGAAAPHKIKTSNRRKS